MQWEFPVASFPCLCCRLDIKAPKQDVTSAGRKRGIAECVVDWSMSGSVIVSGDLTMIKVDFVKS